MKTRYSVFHFLTTVSAVFLLVLVFVGAYALTSKPNLGDCTLSVTSHLDGAKVRKDALIKGKANIPAKHFLWVLAHKQGLKEWWPQGGGEADIRNGEWKVLVTFGKKGEIGEFEMAAIVVDSSAHEDLKRWVKDAPAADFPPISFPNAVAGCSVVYVAVEKTSD